MLCECVWGACQQTKTTVIIIITYINIYRYNHLPTWMFWVGNDFSDAGAFFVSETIIIKMLQSGISKNHMDYLIYGLYSNYIIHNKQNKIYI